MDVDDAPLERTQKIALQHAHETGEDDQIHIGGAQRGDVIALRFLVQLGAKFAGRQELGRNFPPACMRQYPRTFNVAQNDANLRLYLAGVHGIGNGDKIRTLTGTKDAQSK